MDQHEPRLVAGLVEQHRFSLGVVRGLLDRETEAALARLDGRCDPKDIHGEYLAVNIRQFVWIGLQEHASDPRGATLFSPHRRNRKRESLVLTDRRFVTIRVRKHPRLPYSEILEPVAAEQLCLDDPCFESVTAPLYVLFDLDRSLGVLADSWVAAVSNFDDDAKRVIHSRIPLPAAPALLLPSDVKPMQGADPDAMTFDDQLAAEEDSGDDPA